MYRKALLICLAEKGLAAEQEIPLRVRFHEKPVGDFSPDILVEKRVIVEVKATRCLLPEHEAQLLNYLKRPGFKLVC